MTATPRSGKAGPDRARRRRYDSPRRAEQAAQTRAQIVAAAADIFAERGWSATGMRDIATAAGVSIETVYTHFRSKAELLMAAIDVGIVGDSDEIPMAERPEFVALAAGTPRERAAAGAALQTHIQQRVVPLHLVLRQSAGADPDLRQRLDEDEERRRSTVGQAAELIAGRPVTPYERDGLWALVSVEVWHLLVDRSGWTPAHYQAWLEQSILSLLHLEEPVRPINEAGDGR